ncbi:MAG: nucleoside transporter C-terminal domain-containing protein [bacterium]
MTGLKFVSLGGMLVFMVAAWLISENRRRVDFRLIGWGVGLQFVFALAILKTGPGYVVFDCAKVVMTKVLDFTEVGAGFLFGRLVSDQSVGAVVAFKVLPTIVFVSSLMGVLYYFRVIQAAVWVMAKAMQVTMRASGAEAFMAAMFVFMGIESVTAVREYIRRMTRSEMFTVMTAFMATIAGSVMAAYVSFGAEAGHLLAASVMSAPAAIVMAKLVVPEVEAAATGGGSAVSLRSGDVNVIEAAANGAAEGLKLAAVIGGMLLAFVALIGMMDYLLGLVEVGGRALSFEYLAGYVFSPFAFAMGVPWGDCREVGTLLGIKVVFNEFIAYRRMQAMTGVGALQPRSVTIATYALCSFANFGSIAILMGGIGGIAPERKKEVARLGLRALAAGCLAGFMTATIAGILI